MSSLQGFEVTYKGDEWDKEPLQVILMPHSHNDPGWLFTMQGYFDAYTQGILDTIITSLAEVKGSALWHGMAWPMQNGSLPNGPQTGLFVVHYRQKPIQQTLLVTESWSVGCSYVYCL